MKNKMKKYLAKWPYLLLSVIITTSLVSVLINTYCMPRENERISVFSAIYEAKTSEFINECKKVSNEVIREIKLNHGAPGLDSTDYLFGAYYDMVDFYILPSSWMSRINTITAHFDIPYINELIPNSTGLDFLKDEINYYAIKVYDKDSDEGKMKNILSYTKSGKEKEDYYITFRNKSLHLGKLNNSEDDSAVKIVNHLLSL